MFVEVYVPAQIRHSYPLILFHGAGQTNVNWQTTPDGREGWADYFVRNGYVVYLAEQPARGRSAWHPETNGTTIHHPAEVLRERFTTDRGSWPQAKHHTQWPGGGADFEEKIMKQFLCSQVEYIPSNKISQKLVLDCARELLDAPEEKLRAGWVLKEPALQLIHLQNIPVMLMVSETSYHAECDHLVSYLLKQCGGKHDFIRLEEHGIRGNGHMMMVEKNNLEITVCIIQWLTKNVEKEGKEYDKVRSYE